MLLYNQVQFGESKKPPKPKFLMHPHVYTADFKITAFLDSKPLVDFFSTCFKIPQESVYEDIETGREVSDIWIDVKGEWMMNEGRDFSINQKLVYAIHNIYINKFVPRQVFQKLGAPKCAAVTPSGRVSKVFAGMRFVQNVWAEKLESNTEKN